MMALTDFADQAVILPIFAVIALFLLWQRQWFVTAAWLVSVAAVLGVILVLKVLFSSCSWLFPALGAGGVDLHSPSGHTAAASVTYGGLVVLLAARSRRSAVGLALIASVSVAVVIGATRLGLRAHSVSEVLLAAFIGIAGTLAFAGLAGGQVRPGHRWSIAVGVAVVALALHGQHLPAEAAIQGHGVTLMRRMITECDPLQGSSPLHQAWETAKVEFEQAERGSGAL